MRGETILKINGTKIGKEDNFRNLFNKCMHMKLKTTSLETHSLQKINTHIDSVSPQISFDQIHLMLHKHDAASSNTEELIDPHNPSPNHTNNICSSIRNFHSKKTDWI